MIQDADLEYDPRDYPALPAPMSGIAGSCGVRLSLRERFGATSPALLAFGRKLPAHLDQQRIYRPEPDGHGNRAKLFRREIIQSIDLKQDRFGFEPEVTAKIFHRGLRIYEVGISYNGRGYEEGKKIGATPYRRCTA